MLRAFKPSFGYTLCKRVEKPEPSEKPSGLLLPPSPSKDKIVICEILHTTRHEQQVGDIVAVLSEHANLEVELEPQFTHILVENKHILGTFYERLSDIR